MTTPAQGESFNQNMPVNPLLTPNVDGGGQQDATPESTPQSPATAQPGADLTAAIANLTALIQKSGAPARVDQEEVPGNGEGSNSSFGDLNSFDMAGIENPSIRSMAYVLASAHDGLDLNRVMGNALSRFDDSLVDVQYITDVVKDARKAEHIANIAKSIVGAASAEADSLTSAVYASAGGEEAWNQATAVFNQNAPQELRSVIKTMLDSSKPDQVKAAAKLVAEYGKSSGLLQNVGKSVKDGGVAAGASNAGVALDKTTFQTELRKLDPNSSSYFDDREALFARRALGKQRGL